MRVQSRAESGDMPALLDAGLTEWEQRGTVLGADYQQLQDCKAGIQCHP